jgi:hypothetical protein
MVDVFVCSIVHAAFEHRHVEGLWERRVRTHGSIVAEALAIEGERPHRTNTVPVTLLKWHNSAA